MGFLRVRFLAAIGQGLRSPGIKMIAQNAQNTNLTVKVSRVPQVSRVPRVARVNK